MAGFQNLGDLIRRDRDLAKIAIIDLGGEGAGERKYTYARCSTPLPTASPAACSPAASRRGDRVAILSANRAEYLFAYYGIMRAGLVAVPINFKFPRQTIHFIIEDCGAKLIFCDSAAPRRLSGRAGLRVLRRARAHRLRCLSRSRPVRRHRAGRRRAGDDPLHLGLDRNPERRGALPSRPYLGGRDAARRPGPFAPPLSDRGAALSHECAGAEQARLRGPCHHRAAAAIQRARLYRGDRALSLHLAHRRAADDRHDAARAGAHGAQRSLERRVHPHGLGAGEREPDGGHPPRLAAGLGDQCVWHHRGRAGRVRAASARTAAAGAVGRLSASEGAAAAGRGRQPRCGRGRARDEMPRRDAAAITTGPMSPPRSRPTAIT